MTIYFTSSELILNIQKCQEFPGIDPSITFTDYVIPPIITFLSYDIFYYILIFLLLRNRIKRKQRFTLFDLLADSVFVKALYNGKNEYLKGITNIKNIESNLEKIKNIIIKFEELLDKIIPNFNTKTLVIDIKQLLNLVNSISKLCKVSYVYESRFTNNFNINFLLSWFSMNYFYRPEIDVEPIESNAIEEIQLLIDSLPEHNKHRSADDILKGDFGT